MIGLTNKMNMGERKEGDKCMKGIKKRKKEGEG
jgi:hypothetical protein